MAGRQTKLTPQIQERLCAAISAGSYYETACRANGISYHTLRNWMNKGAEAQSGIYFDFFHAVTRAEAQCELNLLKIWQQAAPEDWRAARDFLERRYSDRWGRKERVQHTGDQENPVKIEVNIESMRELLADDTIRDSLRDSA